MKIYCNGERTTMRIWGTRWKCDRCGKKLWKADMAKKIPVPEDVTEVYVYPGAYGFRYTCRGADRKVLYDSPYAFKSRHAARKEARLRWPQARVSFEVK